MRPKVPVLVLLVAALAAGSSSAAVADVAPPAGAPDLTQIALQKADFTGGGHILFEGAVAPDPGASSAYLRLFGPSSVGTTYFTAVDSIVELFPDTASATDEYAGLHSGRGLVTVIHGFVKGFNATQPKSRRLRPGDVRIRPGHAMDVGDASFLVSFTAPVNRSRVVVYIALLRVDRVDAVLVAAGRPGKRVSAGPVTALARAVADRVRAGLAPAPAPAPGA